MVLLGMNQFCSKSNATTFFERKTLSSEQIIIVLRPQQVTMPVILMPY